MRGTIAMVPRARLLVVLIGTLIGAFLLVLAAGAPAQAAKTIEMRGKGKNLRFEGPKGVAAGKGLRVLNRTKPSKVGPHTFTLVKRDVLPTTRKQQKKCFDGPGRVCFRVAVAHEIDFDTFAVGRPLVEVGKAGWDRSFTKKKVGDSWYTETRGEGLTQKVSAKSGSKLHFFCAVHPFMHGEIKVR